jgi:hypothetical protein
MVLIAAGALLPAFGGALSRFGIGTDPREGDPAADRISLLGRQRRNVRSAGAGCDGIGTTSADISGLFSGSMNFCQGVDPDDGI